MYLPFDAVFLNLLVTYLTFKNAAANESQVIECLEKIRTIFNVTDIPNAITVSNYQTDFVNDILTASKCVQNAIQFLNLEHYRIKFTNREETNRMDYNIYDYYISMGKQLDPANIKNPKEFCKRKNPDLSNINFVKKACLGQLKKFEIYYDQIPQKSLREYKDTSSSGCVFGIFSNSLSNYIVENALYMYRKEDFLPDNYDRLYLEHIQKSVLEGSIPKPLDYCKNLYLERPNVKNNE